jgi:hypothetical protein
VNRLGGFWRQRSRRGKTLLVVGAIVAALAIIGAVNSPDEEASVASEPTEATETTETTEVTPTSDPIGCLDAAGLSDVEERDVDVWRGFHDSPFYAIIIHKLSTPAKAPTVVAGTYALTGPFKVAAEGTGLTSDEGLEADALVQEVAACLGR